MRKAKAAEGRGGVKVLDYRRETRRGCAGNPVTFLKSLFARAATQIGAGEEAEVVLDMSGGKISLKGAENVAKSAGLAVVEVKSGAKGVVSFFVKTEG